MADLRIKNLYKSYGEVKVLEGLNLEIASGEFWVLLGPSGCGKSTLLRIIAGLEDETAGEIFLDNQSITTLPPAKRGIAMVFQTYALYPHLSVRGNMSLVLKQAGHTKEEIERRVAESSRALELNDLLDRKPSELSGGQRQRVAIARAIVRNPKLFLFDEPLSNLDASLRGAVRIEIAQLHQRLSSTMVYVTHDQVEAMTLADKIVVMHDGDIQQVGSPRELYETPANLFVAGFIGSPPMNFLEIEKIDKSLAFLYSGETISVGKIAPKTHGKAKMGIRPNAWQLVSSDSKSADIVGEVLLEEYLGDATYVHIKLEDGSQVIVRENPNKNNKIGKKIGINILPDSIHLFDSVTGNRLNG